MDAFAAISEPNRRRILDLVRDQDRSAGELVGSLGISQAGVSKHLRLLREAGLVTVRSEAQRRIYRLAPEKLAELDAWLAPYRRFWADKLDSLEQHLEDRK